MLFDRAQLEAALPQYEVGAQLGRGAFGLVLEGRHRRLGRPVAIKILTISEPDVERRFLAEAQVMAAFDHPHVVRVHDYAESAGLCLIVMEHLPGGTLAAQITDTYPAEQACAVGLAVADALHAAHQRGIVHRDIKPDNVLFAADGAVKVTDFGIAKLFEGSTATTGTLMGTPAYASPEQIMGERIGPATDVYALGGVLYHLLTGQAPFALDLPVPAMLHRHLTQRPVLPAGMPPRIAAVVGQALEKDPAGRQASAKMFALALAAAAVADLGPGWAARSDTPLRIDDEVRNAAAVSKTQVSGRLPVQRPGPMVAGPAAALPGQRSGPVAARQEAAVPVAAQRLPDRWRRDPYDSPPPIADGVPAPALVPVSPGGRTTTTSGGRHAAPEGEAAAAYSFLRGAEGSPAPVSSVPEYGRRPRPESLTSPVPGMPDVPDVPEVPGGFGAPGTTGSGGPQIGRLRSDERGSASASGTASVSGSAYPSAAAPVSEAAFAGAQVESGRRRAPGDQPVSGGAPLSAGNAPVSNVGYPPGPDSVGPEPRAPRAAILRRGQAAAGSESQPWWASRTRLIILMVALVVLAAISVAVGIAVGNAHRSAELSGAPAPSHGQSRVPG